MARAVKTEVLAHEGARNGAVGLVDKADHLERTVCGTKRMSKGWRESSGKGLSKECQGSRIGDLHRASQTSE